MRANAPGMMSRHEDVKEGTSADFSGRSTSDHSFKMPCCVFEPNGNRSTQGPAKGPTRSKSREINFQAMEMRYHENFESVPD